MAVFLRTCSHTSQAFLETSSQHGHILLERRTATTPGTSRPSLWNFKHGRYCETGPMVYSPYPRRCLTICWYNFQRQLFLLSYFKTFSPAEVELTTSRVTARCSTNWAMHLPLFLFPYRTRQLYSYPLSFLLKLDEWVQVKFIEDFSFLCVDYEVHMRTLENLRLSRFRIWHKWKMYILPHWYLGWKRWVLYHTVLPL